MSMELENILWDIIREFENKPTNDQLIKVNELYTHLKEYQTSVVLDKYMVHLNKVYTNDKLMG